MGTAAVQPHSRDATSVDTRDNLTEASEHGTWHRGLGTRDVCKRGMCMPTLRVECALIEGKRTFGNPKLCDETSVHTHCA